MDIISSQFMPKDNTDFMDYQIKPGYTVKQGAHAVANFGIVVSITSIMTTAAQYPISSVMFNLIQTGKPFAAALFNRGFFPALTASSVRSGYVLTTKDAVSQSGVKEPGTKSSLTRALPLVALVTVGDVVVTQVPETIGKLTQRGLSSDLYKWNTTSNLATLGKLGIAARYTRGMINFTGLCIATDFYAKYIPGDNQHIKQTVGGMASGLTATLISFPFGYYVDYFLTKVTVIEGNLLAPKASKVIYDGIQQFRAMDSQQLKQFAQAVAIQGGLRALRTGVSFAIISGVTSALGTTPLNRINNLTHKFKTALFASNTDKSKEQDPDAPTPDVKP